ncbi:unnamed protein product [Cercopithifilaria johnstoni]|uniref:Peptidase metallopeptidase domain-containing protein n=1 Tax=Cercopithifilaria johnstoni TaxID=2874296 RepID=A0A8J2M6W2_9BILA|nr:unnamed protein product [Cercopithifilaria johnstoni]
MFKVIMTIKEFLVFVREGIYSLRFTVTLLTFIVLLFIIVQLCEVIYSFMQLKQPSLENDEYYPTEIITEDPNNSSKLSLKKGRRSNEDSIQLPSFNKETKERNYHIGIFDKKLLEMEKSSPLSASLILSNSLNRSRKQLEENSPKQSCIIKEQSTNEPSITTNDGSKKSSIITINSPSKEKICRSAEAILVLNENKWYTGTLSWSFRDPFRLFKNDQKFIIVKSILRQAFEKWSNSSGGALIFEDLSPMDRTSGNTGANFDVLFAKYAHGDKESFDGFGGIVAHSGYPVEGIIHFDASEYWSINGRTGLDLRYVALHEIGHALGLRHSNDPKAIMNPYYSDQLKKGFELGEDDILGIKKLYGTS